MSDPASKPIRSPSYPSMALREAVQAVGKIENQYRASPIDRKVAAKLIGFSMLSGPANKALAALASYGLVERAGKGEMRVTERARAILHAGSESEKVDNLRAAAFEPSLFCEIRDRFEGVNIPPEDGVVTYLNRQGFNPNAIKPATKAFLQTLGFLEELGVTESHGSGPEKARELGSLDGDAATATYGGARAGDLVQWESSGVLQFTEPRRVRLVTDDGEWVAVEGSETGIPMNEVIVQDQKPKDPAVTPPTFAIDPSREDAHPQVGEVEWMRNRVGMETNVRLMVKGEMGPKEIKRLIRILEAQRAVLMDEDDEVDERE